MQQISYINSKITDLREENDKFHNLFEFNDSRENILKIVSHDSQMFLITYKQEIDYKGTVTEFEYNGYILKKHKSCLKKPFITMRCYPRYNEEPYYLKSIFIEDFKSDPNYRDKGFGTIIMNELIQYAKKLNVKYISGELSFVDIGKDDEDDSCKDKRERLYHFYPKFGFIIEEHKMENGRIKKTIKLSLKK